MTDRDNQLQNLDYLFLCDLAVVISLVKGTYFPITLIYHTMCCYSLSDLDFGSRVGIPVYFPSSSLTLLKKLAL